jgi:2-haloacid dehalogenase
MEHAGIASFVERIFYVDDAGVYKPDERVYALVTDHYGIEPPDVVFVTSNGWDATGGTAFGYRVAWCNRLANPAETFGPPPAWTIATLSALPELLATA